MELTFSIGAAYDAKLRLPLPMDAPGGSNGSPPDAPTPQHTVQDTVRNAIRDHNLPCYLEPWMAASTERLVGVTATAADGTTAPLAQHETLMSKARALAERYQATHQSLRPASTETSFAAAYHQLIHSSGGSAFETLVLLERKYVQALAEVMAQRDRAFIALRTKQAEQMETVAAKDPNAAAGLVNQHINDLEFMQVKWATEIEEVKRIQRQEYREFVLKYYAEHEAELARERQRPAVEGPTSPVPVEPGTPPSAVKELQDMGFGAAQAECALMLADGNRDEAITILLERPHQVEELLQTSKPTPIPVHQKTASTPKHQQAQQVAASSPSSATGWTIRNSLGGVSSALSRTIGRVGFASGRSETAGSLSSPASLADGGGARLSESFTVFLGNQHKIVCNIRLSCFPPGGLFSASADAEQETAQHAQTAMTLYSMSLSGTVLFAPLDALSKQRVGHAGLLSRCERSTEFHFEPLEAQIALANEQLFTTRGSLSQGDFFVTRHSTLPLTHVVFHMLADARSLTTGSELSGRSPLMTGMRTILRVAAKHDVVDVSFPLLMTANETAPIAPEDLSASLRKAETVLKCIRGYLLENTRQGNSGSVRDGRTLQLLLPAPTTPDQFAHFRNLVATVFRVQ